MTAHDVDLVVIGAGPAGTAAALRGADLGATTALVTRGAFGGMAANDGPIPVRTLAHAARLIREARQLGLYGISTGDVALDYRALLARARQVVAETAAHSTLRPQIDRAGVTVYEHAGTAKFVDAHTIACERSLSFRAKKVVICAGGISRKLNVPGWELTVTPSDAFGFTSVPESAIVIGAGATGVQVASIFNAFGTRIDLFQTGPRIIPTEDEEVSLEVAAAFREDGMAVHEDFGSIVRFERSSMGVRMTFCKNAIEATVEAQVAVSTVGWVADVAGLQLANAGVETNDRDSVLVNEYLRTSNANVFAAGDITGRLMLVPQGVREGFIAGNNAAGGKAIRVPGDVEPIGSFTDPEYAKVGMTEAEARGDHAVVVARAAYAETTRPIIDGRTRGFCKLVADRTSLQILGCHVVGERAVEVAQMAAIAMTAGMKIDDLARLPLSFPTYANVVGRAALRAVRELGASPS